LLTCFDIAFKAMLLSFFFCFFFFGLHYLATCIFLFFYNEPELGVGIDPGMALTPLPSSIGWGSIPRPSDHEPSALPIDHSFCFAVKVFIGSVFFGSVQKVKPSVRFL
jgi:hypothetical protein